MRICCLCLLIIEYTTVIDYRIDNNKTKNSFDNKEFRDLEISYIMPADQNNRLDK